MAPLDPVEACTPMMRREQLLVELQRLEKAIEHARAGRPSDRAQRLLPLETQRARMLAMLRSAPP